MDQILMSAAQQLENQLDSEIQKLDNLSVDDIDAIREKRLKEMKARQEKIIVWKTNVRQRKRNTDESNFINWCLIHCCIL